MTVLAEPTVHADTPTSVFADYESVEYATYEVELTFLNELHGGVPTDPKMVRGWLQRNSGHMTDEEQHAVMFLKTFQELGYDLSSLGDTSAMSYAELVEKAAELVEGSKIVAFRRDEAGNPCLREYNLKAMLKESANIVFAGQWFNKTTGVRMPTRNTQVSKGLKSLLAEWISIDPIAVSLGEVVPEVVTKISHTSNGSGLSLYEQVERPVVRFRLSVLHDLVGQDIWAALWTHAQRNGIGANRSLGYGRFVVTQWEKR